MKKLLAALALGAAAVSLSAPAAAQDVRGRVSITIGDQGRYGQDYYNRPEYRGYEYNRGRGYGVTRHRNDQYLYWQYFSRAPSFIPGYCNYRYNVVVRDPRTSRLVCMDRNMYDRYRFEMRYNRR